MAQPEALALEGPAQRGRGVPGQYVYTARHTGQGGTDFPTKNKRTAARPRAAAEGRAGAGPYEAAAGRRTGKAEGTWTPGPRLSCGCQQLPAQNAPDIQKTITLEPVIVRVIVVL